MSSANTTPTEPAISARSHSFLKGMVRRFPLIFCRTKNPVTINSKKLLPLAKRLSGLDK